MENVTDQTSNPFGMRAGSLAVYGYGDANADFHVIGDHPGVHGGRETGVPFTETVSGIRLQRVLHALGFAREPYSDAPTLDNVYLSYAHLRVPEGTPSPAEYADAERFLDAELRAINAHILLPVGEAALSYTLREHTSRANTTPHDPAGLHAQQLRGRGFMIVPVKEPSEWTAADETALVESLTEILNSDYRQTKGVATTIG